MLSLGLDPGAKGAVVLVDSIGTIVFRELMPTIEKKLDPYELMNTIGRAVDFATAVKETLTATIESVASMPGQGVSSVFTFGKGFGYLEMALVAHKIPYQLVSPQRWQKLAHEGVSKETYPDPKSRSLIAARRRWPGEMWLATAKSKVPHDGLIDAAWLAVYGLRAQASAVA